MQQRYAKKHTGSLPLGVENSSPTRKSTTLGAAPKGQKQQHSKTTTKRTTLSGTTIQRTLFAVLLCTFVLLLGLNYRHFRKRQRPTTTTNNSATYGTPNEEVTTDDIVFQFPIRPLPDWMTEYMAWHAEQLLHIDENNWREKQYRYLIARCLDIDRACGGVSDRLKSLPTLLLLARLSNRIFFIHWNRPIRLEDIFVLPTSTNNRTTTWVILNWTVPSFIPVQGSGTRLYTKLTTLIKATIVQNSSVPVLCARVQDQHGGSEFYNANHPPSQQPADPSVPVWNNHPHRAFRHVFRSLFFTLFRPSNRLLQPLGRILHNEFNVTPGMYDAVHFRAYYSAAMSPDQIAPWAINAVYCAYQHLNHIQLSSSTTVPPVNTSATGVPTAVNRPILFLSDSNVAIQAVRDHFTSSTSSFPIQVLTLSRDADPMHLDKSVPIDNTDGHLNVFVDLLLMAHARCIAHGQGGYGRFGVLLSANPTCFFKYFENSKWKVCTPPPFET
jgi:hypothetical protein